MANDYNPMHDAYKNDPTRTLQGPRLVVLSWRELFDRMYDANQHRPDPDTDRNYHTLASVVAGLIPADEEELAAQQAAELQRQAEALKPRLVARFVASRSWAERWTDDPEKIKQYFLAEEVEIKEAGKNK